MSKSPHLSRNDFVKATVAALSAIMGAIVGIPIVGYFVSPALKSKSSEAWIPLGPLENFPIGTPTLSNFTRTKINGWEKSTNSYGVYVYRKNEGEAIAMSNVCTHLSCRVNWKEEEREYICPCHIAHFDVDGNVTFGPPPRPLERYETKVEEGNLSIHFVEG